MTCRLSDFVVQPERRSELLPDGSTFTSAAATTRGDPPTLDGVVYWVDGVFQGFCGSHDGAKANAARRRIRTLH